MKFIQIPTLAGAQTESWKALLEVAERLPDGWTLIGGQLVQLHCWERGSEPGRITTDVDTVLDFISDPMILERFTGMLNQIGFSPETTPEGHQYKWRRGLAEIDLLFPNNVGERTLSKLGVTGGTIIETPGGRRVLDFSEKVLISLDGAEGIINRPHLFGAIFAKSVALANVNDVGRDRHLRDLAILVTHFSGEDLTPNLNLKVREKVNSGIARLRSQPGILALTEGSIDGLARLAVALEMS